MSGATRSFMETRHQVDFGVRRKIGEADARLGYSRSQENDYLSQTFLVGGSLDLFQRNTTLSLSLAHMADASTPVWTRGVTRLLETNGFDLGATQVLTRKAQARLVFSYADAEGYLSDPYAFIQIGNQTGNPMPARQPGSRQRMDVSAAFKQDLGWRTSGELGYRYYQDSWGVYAHTVDLGVTKQVGDWMLEPSYRYYTQSQAFFFRNFYEVNQPYITRDLKLAAFSTQLLGLELTGKLTENLTLHARYSHFLRADSLDYSLYYANGPSSADLWQLGITLE
jgi:hypothetical protein